MTAANGFVALISVRAICPELRGLEPIGRLPAALGPGVVSSRPLYSWRATNRARSCLCSAVSSARSGWGFIRRSDQKCPSRRTRWVGLHKSTPATSTRVYELHPAPTTSVASLGRRVRRIAVCYRATEGVSLAAGGFGDHGQARRPGTSGRRFTRTSAELEKSRPRSAA